MNTETLTALRLAGIDPASLPDLESMVPGAANLTERGSESDWQKKTPWQSHLLKFPQGYTGQG